MDTAEQELLDRFKKIILESMSAKKESILAQTWSYEHIEGEPFHCPVCDAYGRGKSTLTLSPNQTLHCHSCARTYTIEFMADLVRSHKERMNGHMWKDTAHEESLNSAIDWYLEHK